MDNFDVQLLFNRNKSFYHLKYPTIKNGWFIYEDRNNELDFNSIKRLLYWISGIHTRYQHFRPMLSINYPTVKAVDKLTLQLLECIIFSLLNDFGHRVSIAIHLDPDIHSEGFRYSPIRYLNQKKPDKNQFNKLFECDMRLNHYRRIVPKKWSYHGELGEYIFPDVVVTLNRNGINDDNYANGLAEVITELLNNANEHNDADCLLDLDVTGDYHRRDDTKGNYIGVNVSVISFADTYIYEPIKRKIATKQYSGIRYESVAKAYSIHKTFFDDDYTEKDFFTIAAFQDKISGRLSRDYSGGTGLTKLLQSLEKYSDSSMCYMVSNNRALRFVKELLDYDKDGWVAFNQDGDFINSPPVREVFRTSPIVFPGIGYNLTFVYKKGDNNESN